jgi:DNA primase large subunit
MLHYDESTSKMLLQLCKARDSILACNGVLNRLLRENPDLRNYLASKNGSIKVGTRGYSGTDYQIDILIGNDPRYCDKMIEVLRGKSQRSKDWAEEVTMRMNGFADLDEDDRFNIRMEARQQYIEEIFEQDVENTRQEIITENCESVEPVLSAIHGSLKTPWEVKINDGGYIYETKFGDVFIKIYLSGARACRRVTRQIESYEYICEEER